MYCIAYASIKRKLAPFTHKRTKQKIVFFSHKVVCEQSDNVALICLLGLRKVLGFIFSLIGYRPAKNGDF